MGSIETDVQFLARMLVAVREGEQIATEDADKLGHLANYGPGPYPQAIPEATGAPSASTGSTRVSGPGRVHAGQEYPVIDPPERV